MKLNVNLKVSLEQQHNLKELSLCHKHWFSNPYIFANQCCIVDLRYFKLWVMLHRYRDLKILVCGKNSIPLKKYKLQLLWRVEWGCVIIQTWNKWNYKRSNDSFNSSRRILKNNETRRTWRTKTSVKKTWRIRRAKRTRKTWRNWG